MAGINVPHVASTRRTASHAMLGAAKQASHVHSHRDSGPVVER